MRIAPLLPSNTRGLKWVDDRRVLREIVQVIRSGERWADAPGLSASTITRLKGDWWDEYERWSKRDLSARRYVYF